MNPDEQASLWAARCEASELNESDQAGLQAWLTENPDHGTLLAEYRRLSAILHQELPALVAAGSAALPPPPAPVHGRRLGWFLAGCAAAAAIACAFWLAHPGQRAEDVATAAGQRRTITLADGSQVELSARTSLQYAVVGHQRLVQLNGGEAFFAVAKDHSRPFIIDTGAGSIRVTGTKFDVLAQPGEPLQVTVLEGSVLATPKGLPAVTLKAGDRLVAGRPVEKLNSEELGDALAWRDGVLVFSNAPLTRVISRFAYYYGQDIHAAPEVPDLRISGRFHLDDLDGFFSALEDMEPVRVNRQASGAVVVVPDARPR